jgi:tetratricopeptide (TPR) repeat protein
LVKLDKSTIHRAILESGTIPSHDAGEIEKISSQYPFFNTAQVLLSKVYQKAGDHRFIDQLNQAAMYSIDRKILHRYIHASLPSEDKIENLTSEASSLPAEIPIQNIESDAEDKTPPSFAKDLESDPAEISDMGNREELSEKIILTEKTSEQEIDALVNSILEREEVEQLHARTTEIFPENALQESLSKTAFSVNTTSNISPPNGQPAEEEIASNQREELPFVQEKPLHIAPELDKEILLEALQSSIELEVSEMESDVFEQSDDITSESIEKPSFNQSKGEEESLNLPMEKAQTYADWIYQRSQQIHFSDASRKPLENENAVPDLAADWLREETFSEINEENVVPSAPEIAPIPENEEKEQTTLSHGVTRIGKPDKKTHQRDLVDRFIKKEPRITPGKSVDYLPGNLFKDSLEEDYEFMTETIAQLLARQGKFDKARKAYRKLIEQHPEKSVYFAAQLKNLDRLKKP